MKIHWIAALACLALALTPGTSLAQKKAPAAAGKWEKRMVGCFGTMCPPKC